MKNYKRRSIFLYAVIIISLFINIVLYIKYEEEKDKNMYIHDIVRTIRASTRPHLEYLITNITCDKNLERWKPIIQEIRDKSSKSYKIENYIVIKYDNGNTLMVETGTNELKLNGRRCIADMFFLDEQQYKRFIYTKE
ncbi:hypothetical protein [Caloranaerobacter ferrireducens]|uniref:hypothetical protein n=1 Tax=Caloranaerobacter ferrireducens TaxID=1323370 RepID=UPI00084D1340|nr:hypothetical protein [Caloranaerobacter ferrireducens]